MRTWVLVRGTVELGLPKRWVGWIYDSQDGFLRARQAHVSPTFLPKMGEADGTAAFEM